jgi:hypothetical protein
VGVGWRRPPWVFRAVVAGAGFVSGPLMLGGARCLD